MRIIRSSHGIIARLDRGEEVISSLEALVTREGLQGASIIGLGALKDCELGYLDPVSRTYQRLLLKEDLELLNLTGNVTFVDDKVRIHAHVTVSGPDFVARGGHLFSAVVAVTLELQITPWDVKLNRAYDDVSGAWLIAD